MAADGEKLFRSPVEKSQFEIRRTISIRGLYRIIDD